MDIGTGIALGTLVIGTAIPVTSYIVTRNDKPKNGQSPMTKELCEAKHKTLDFKIDLLLKHFDIDGREDKDF